MSDAERIVQLEAALRVFADLDSWNNKDTCGYHGCPTYPGITWLGPEDDEDEGWLFPWEAAQRVLENRPTQEPLAGGWVSREDVERIVLAMMSPPAERQGDG